MQCSCSIDCEVDEYCLRLSDGFPIARKQHKCGECGRAIERGEKYRREGIVFDGAVSTEKTCLDCNSIRTELFSSFSYGMMWADFWDYVRECHGNVPEKCLAKMTPNARAWVCGVIDAVGKKMTDKDAT